MNKKYPKISISNAKNLRTNATTPEKILWTYLRKSSLNNLKFRRQQPIGPYIVDFLCCSRKIIIELDGGQHNMSKNIDYDNIRDNFLKEEGYTVIRIWNNDIIKNIDGVIEFLQDYTKTPTPKSKILTLPSREGNRNIKIQCPAKINLTLKITGKRPDGFHDIESVMQTINLFDYLTISTAANGKFEINLSGTSSEIPYNEKNLVYKAALLFIERTNLQPCKINVFIEKNIPVAAGLAGGSTDAAGMLYGLNKLYGEPLNRFELHELCAKLGSDLNMCLEGGRQKATGRGEILEKLPFEEFEVSLIKPVSLGISAKDAYTKFSRKMESNSSPADKTKPPTPTLPLKGGGGKHSHKYNRYAKEKSAILRKNMTDAENKLWYYIRKEQINGLKFRRQQPIGPYIADFVCQSLKLVIELDGGQHNEENYQEYDSERTVYLEKAGYKVLRFWNNEIFENIEGVTEKISNFANSLPPRGGGSGWGATAFLNDLEWAVIDDYKELRQIKTLYPNSVMSGSGSTYFGIGFEFEKQPDFWVKNNLKSIPYGVKEV